jgi:hypothetical protein
MSLNKIILLVISIILNSNPFFSQNDSLEVFIIDAYVTPETPHKFNLSFFTSEEVKTKVDIDGKYLFNVSEEFSEDHSSIIDFTEYYFENKYVPFKIISENENGEISKSEKFEIVLPYEQFIETKKGDNPISTILFGVLLYILPSPNLFLTNDKEYFSLTKELPILTFYSSGYNYPAGNISIEYTHIYDSSQKNILRLGYKHFIPIDVFEYISPGVTGFSNFSGFNGVGAEASLGLFKVYDVFTVYSRYRFNFAPSDFEQHFHEISIGLYSHFFTIDF